LINRRRVILGVDPGIALVGFGVLVHEGQVVHLEHGVIATPASDSTPLRLRAIYEALTQLKRQYAPTDVAMEMLYYSRNVTTAMSVGQARGVALLATVDESTGFGEYTPNEIKQAVAGYGAAKKRQVQDMVQLILRLPTLPVPDDAADALAVALCHARRIELEGVLGVHSQAVLR
jgi:crossover junction endodeoxyribonuclease RuvC